MDTNLPRRDSAEPRFSCGLTAADHREICADVIRREAELVKVGQQHAPEYGIHLQLANHTCNSTLAWPLPGHRLVTDDDGGDL